MTSSEEVRSFYDDFTNTRFATYSPGSNVRIEMAIKRILSIAKPGMKILEIGSGIGIVTERLHDCIPNAHIWACDTSQEAIDVANARLQSHRLDFRQFDALSEFDAIKSWISVEVDLVILIDVIEHIPASFRDQLIQNLKSQLHEEGHILFTFPSANYQEHLKAENPAELQIIDETITAEDIVRSCSNAGLILSHYSLETAWLQNQYVHCIFSVSAPLTSPKGRLEKSKDALTSLRVNFSNSKTLSAHFVTKVVRKLKSLSRSTEH